MDTFGLILLAVGLFICVTECRPESSQSSPVVAAPPLFKSSSRFATRSTDQMVFPESAEDERGGGGGGSSSGLIASMQMRRPLSPTPASSSDCRQIKVVRYKNGTLAHRYVDCDNSTATRPTSIGNRFDPAENEPPVRQAGGSQSDQHQRLPMGNTTQSGVGSSGDSRDSIVFPDTDQADGNEPDCAHGQRFCTDDSSYPKSKIELLLQRFGNLNDLLQTDVPDDTELAQRVDVPGEETFCEYDSRMEYPTKALSRDEKWLPIVNHANYTQGIRMEICRNIDRPCKMSEIFPYSIKTKCVQKYQYRQLLALHEDGQLKREYFSMPTCCLCTFSKM